MVIILTGIGLPRLYKYMSSLLGRGEGLYNNTRRFAFTNITEEVFTSAWDSQPITVQPGQTVELPHHLADKLTDELVNQIMIGDAKLDEVTKNQPYYRSPKGSSLGVPAARKVWEDQIVRELQVDEESPEIQVMRAKIREEVLADLKREPAKTEIQLPSMTEFAEIKEGSIKEVPRVKRAYKVRAIKVE